MILLLLFFCFPHPCIILIHFHLLISCKTIIPTLIHGPFHMQSNCIWVHLIVLPCQLSYFDASIKLTCIIPWLCIMPCYWLFVSLRCLFASSRIDDDVETDEVYDTPSEDLAQYQAVEFAGKYSLTWTIVFLSTLDTDTFRCLFC